MKRKNPAALVRQYVLFLLGLLVNAFGIAFMTKASLGTTPISSMPYAMSMILPQLTFGEWTLVYGLILVAAQWAILKQEADKRNLLLQAIFCSLFGYLVDFAMFCLAFLHPVGYPLQLVTLVTGCTITAAGVYLTMTANVVMLSADALARVAAKKLGKEYSQMRTASDGIMTLTAACLCLLFLGRLGSVREGTLIAALITGRIIKILSKVLAPLTRILQRQIQPV